MYYGTKIKSTYAVLGHRWIVLFSEYEFYLTIRHCCGILPSAILLVSLAQILVFAFLPAVLKTSL